MNADEFKIKLDSAIDKIGESLPAIIDLRALNAVSIMKSRFIQKGTTVDTAGDEISFPAYSTSYKKKKDKIFGGTPNRLVGVGSKSKNVAGGDMLRKLQIINRTQSESMYSVTIGGIDSFSQEKLEKDAELYGDILNLTNQEIETLAEDATNDLLEIFERALE